MNYRPYPNRDRALAQVERRPEPPRCPICDHPVNRHALEGEQRVCTRGQGLISCRDCAELRARIPTVAALMEFGRAMKYGTHHRLLVTQPRRAGKTTIVKAIADQAAKAGEHVHVATRDGVRCAGGDPACPLPRKAPEPPIVLARVDRTCTAVPSQWNAWTTGGQYLYMRYRSGIGTVDAFDSPTPEAWPHFAAGLVARFEHGGRYAGDMSLVEFCERTGLQLAEDAEVTGE